MYKSTALLLLLNFIPLITFTDSDSHYILSTTSINSTTIRNQRSVIDIIFEQPFIRDINNIGHHTLLWVINIIPRLLAYVLSSIRRTPDLINKSVPLDVIENIVDQFIAGTKNEDIHLNITQLIQKYGFNVEVHKVQTNDGYILTIFRIPRCGPVTFLMHGLLSSADDWVTAGPKSSIAYLLASEGYDVWLGNARGNKHSRKHAHLSPNDAQFWDFSWDEIGRFDLPCMIDYVLTATGQFHLKYVGHSQGTTAFFVMCSERPEYNEKVSLMIALSAVAWMSHLKSPIVRLLSPHNPFLYIVLKAFGIHEFAPNNFLIKALETAMCGKEELAKLFCSNVVFILCGFDYAQLNITNLPVFFGHVPSGAATKQLVHYGQGVVSGKFQRFDYGEKKNEQKYGSKYPPLYPVEKISTPVAIFYSSEDWLASVIDVQILRDKLQNVVDFYKIPDKSFNHLDFIWAKNVKQLVYYRILQLFKNE